MNIQIIIGPKLGVYLKSFEGKTKYAKTVFRQYEVCNKKVRGMTIVLSKPVLKVYS